MSVVQVVVLLLESFPLRHIRPWVLKVVLCVEILRQFAISLSATLLVVVVVVTVWHRLVVLVLSRRFAVLLVIVRVGVGLVLSGRPLPISISWILVRPSRHLALLQPSVIKVLGFVTRVRVPGSSYKTLSATRVIVVL